MNKTKIGLLVLDINTSVLEKQILGLKALLPEGLTDCPDCLFSAVINDVLSCDCLPAVVASNVTVIPVEVEIIRSLDLVAATLRASKCDLHY